MFKIKNKDVLNTYAMLMKLELPFSQSRIRTKFCKLLGEYNDNEYVVGRREIFNHFTNFDEEGNTIVLEENKKPLYEQLQMLDNEEFKLECNEVNKDMFLGINKILHDDFIFHSLSGDDAILHDMLCDEFERIEDTYND